MVDSDLIKRCQSGEEEAYDSLYKVVYKKALWTAYLICRNTDKAEDIIQETFYECFRDIGKLRKTELFQAWFNRILIRKCRKLTRNRIPAESLDDDNKIELKDDVNVLDIVETNQLNLQVRKAIDRLRTPLRTTIILFYYNELSIKEISQVMNCFQGTVKSRLHYAKKILYRELEKEVFPANQITQNHNSKEGIVYE